MKTFKQLKEEIQLDEIKLSTVGKIIKHSPKIVGTVVGAAAALNSAEPPKQPVKSSVTQTVKKVQNEENELDESSDRLKSKFIKFAEPKAKGQGLVGHLTGQDDKVQKANKTLALVSKIRNKMDSKRPVYETVESDLQKLQHHVTNTVPSLSNTLKMHDMVRNISKTHGVSANKLYSDIANNEAVHKDYRNAASE